MSITTNVSKWKNKTERLSKSESHFLTIGLKVKRNQIRKHHWAYPSYNTLYIPTYLITDFEKHPKMSKRIPVLITDSRVVCTRGS